MQQARLAWSRDTGSHSRRAGSRRGRHSFESTATSGKGIRSAFNAAIRSALAYADELAESELNVAPEAINGEQLLELMHRVETDEVGSRSGREAVQESRCASANLMCIDPADLQRVELARSSASLDAPAPALNVSAALNVHVAAEVPAQSEGAASIVPDRMLGEAIERRQNEIVDWRGDPGPAIVPTADRRQVEVPVDKAERAEAMLVAESHSAAEIEPVEPSCGEYVWAEEDASRAAIPVGDSQSLSFSVDETGPAEAILTVESNSAADTQPREPSTDELAWSDEGPTQRPRGNEGTPTLAPLEGIGAQQEISPPEDDSPLEKPLERPSDPNDGAIEVEMDFPPVLESHASRASESELGLSMSAMAPPALTPAVSSHGGPVADEGTALTSPGHESEAAVAEILAEESAQQDCAENAHAESVLLPNAEQAPEDVWPLEVWREVCSQMDSSPREASWENGFWTGELAPRWLAVSSTSFGDRESGRAALRSAVERHELLQTYLWPHRCLVLSPDGPDYWRLWEIVSAAVSMAQILRRILTQEVDAQQTARGLMMVCNSYIRTTRQFAAAPEFLEASFNCIAPLSGRLVYAGLLLDTQPPEGVTGKPMDLLEKELRLHLPNNVPQTMDVQAVSREMIGLVYNGAQAEIAELLCSLLVGH